MKNCQPIEKKLLAYLHGELGEHDRLAVQVHLDGCAACRAALEAQRATLELLGTALETASAPEKLTARRTIPHRVSVRQSTFADYWYSPKLRAALVTGAACSVLFLISVSFVAVKVIVKEDASFEAKTVTRPKMPTKKLEVPVDVKKQKSKPKLRKRIVVNKASGMESEIKMPEITGVKGGLGNMGGNGLGSLGFDMVTVDRFGGNMVVESAESSSEPAPALVPKIPLNKLRMEKPSKPKSSAKITAVVSRPELNVIQFPDLADSGIGAGLAGGSSELVAFAEGDRFSGFMEDAEADSYAADDLFGVTVTATSGNEATVVLSDGEWKEERSKKEAIAEELGVELRIDHLKALPVQDEVPEQLGERKAAEFNPYVLAVENAFSTFSIDVDTAAYGLARRQLLSGGLPVPESVRTEEFINSFNYDYRPPTGKQTFSAHNEMAPSPFRPGMELLKVGIKGRRIGRDDHRGAVLTLVIDTSGSMATPERMGLVKKSLALLLNELGPVDEVAIVQFGGTARLVLDHTPAIQKEALLKAVEKLQPGGPTQFDAGLELGYAMATAGFKAGASNRIIIMSDGVANVGELDPEAMLLKVAEHRRKGIYLSVLGFGAGTYDDDLLERLANRGDGMYAYVDTLGEAQNLFVDRLAATLHVIASDVKIQIEFNPDRVLRYRQLGYENRQLTQEQFRDDTVDAGEVGSGQSVTALYDVELTPTGDRRDPIATVYVRYRRADTGVVEEISHRVMDSVRHPRFIDAPPRFRVAACASEFAERLRRSPYTEATQMQDILKTLEPVVLEMELDTQVHELLQLISIANGLEK